MVQKCMYCKCELSDGRTMEVCDKCGEKVWGAKMFNSIVQNMDNARDNGNLCHMNNTCDFSSESELR